MEKPKKTSIENLLDDTLQGLILPEKNISWDFVTWFSIVFIVSLILFGLWRWFNLRQQAKSKAIRQLIALENNNLQHSPQSNAIEVSRLLRKGLGISRLALFKANDLDQWKAFTKQLDSACYSTVELKEAEIKRLIKQSKTWLRQS